MNLQRINLNLLAPFIIFMQERHISRAALKLHMTQSSASKVLNQLRETFNDPLLIRAKSSMEPTECALQLYEKILPIVQQMENLDLADHAFDPANFDRVIKIGMSNAIAEVVVPLMMNPINDLLPKIRADIFATDIKSLQQRLHNGDIEMAIAYANQLPTNCKSTLLYIESPVCLARPSHPILKQKKISLKEFIKYEHVVLRHDDYDPAPLGDKVLHQYGLSARRVKLTVRSPLAALPVVAESDLLLTLGKSFAQLYAAKFNLDYRPFSSDIITVPVHLAWPAVFDSSIWHQNLRKYIKKLAGE